MHDDEGSVDGGSTPNPGDDRSDASATRVPPATDGADELPSPRDGPLEAARWFLRVERGPAAFLREVLASALAVALVGLLLFAVSGVWPPMVAVESGSMHPHLQPGDLVFVVDEHRYVPAEAHDDTGVVTYEAGRPANYRKFDSYGDVVVYDSPDRTGAPVIHRARFWVAAGENWYDRANPNYVRASECGATPTDHLRNCPAPHAGFVTKGDANPYYDQAAGISSPVKPAWVRGTAEQRVPKLGCVRLWFSGNAPRACML